MYDYQENNIILTSWVIKLKSPWLWHRISSWRLNKTQNSLIVYLDHVTYPDSILNHLSRETTLVLKANMARYWRCGNMKHTPASMNKHKGTNRDTQPFPTSGSKIIVSYSRSKSPVGANMWFTRTHPTILQISPCPGLRQAAFLTGAEFMQTRCNHKNTNHLNLNKIHSNGNVVKQILKP